MTEEQAIKGLKENLCSLCAYGSQNMDSCDIRECDNRDYIKALERQSGEDCVSRQEINELFDSEIKMYEERIETRKGSNYHDETERIKEFRSHIANAEYWQNKIKALPPVTLTHGMCKDCTKSKILNGFEGYSIVCSRFGRMAVNPDFFCANFEKRDKEEV